MRTFIACLTGKILRFFCRLFNRGGTGLPGRIALKICPDLLGTLSKGVSCVVITGTNGKTTSVRMVEEGFRLSGLSYFANLTGANLIEGITTDFIMNSSLTGKCSKKFAILETDEFASKEVCRYTQPKVIYVTNLFVDQVERFGGVGGTLAGISTAVSNAKDATLVLNADDSVSSAIGRDVPNKTVYFSIDKSALENTPYSGSSDVTECSVCGGKLEYDYMTFSHLGAFRCTKCGYSRPEADVRITRILSSGLDGSQIKVEENKQEILININLPAMYNMYNALGAYAVMRNCGISRDTAADALGSFTCGFGRMEFFPQLGRCGGRMVLVKNGAGCDQVIDYLKKYDEDFVLAIYLNNNVSDGVDISWLDTADFESLKQCRIEKIYVSGMRAEEMYARLIKAGFDDSALIKQTDTHALISSLRQSDKPVFILPTYTGMMATRSEIVKQCGGSEYWEDK